MYDARRGGSLHRVPTLTRVFPSGPTSSTPTLTDAHRLARQPRKTLSVTGMSTNTDLAESMSALPVDELLAVVCAHSSPEALLSGSLYSAVSSRVMHSIAIQIRRGISESRRRIAQKPSGIYFHDAIPARADRPPSPDNSARAVGDATSGTRDWGLSAYKPPG